jgi:hypothetical protein
MYSYSRVTDVEKCAISVLIWPDVSQDMEQYAGTMNGYKRISWKYSGLRCCAVADTNRDDLAALKALIQPLA